MKMLSALIAGAATSLALSCFLIVTNPQITLKRDGGGTVITVNLANPDGPELSAVPAPSFEDLKPVPAPEPGALPEASDAFGPTAVANAAEPTPTLAASTEGLQAQSAARPTSERSPAGNTSKNASGSTGVARASQPARAGQGGGRPGRTRPVVIYRDVPCVKDDGSSGWSQATQPRR